MINQNIRRLGVLFTLCLALVGCSMMESKVHIIDIKMATAIDDNMAPVTVTDTFPKNTTKVFCWFQWRDSKINTQIMAKWDYVTDNIHILDCTFSIPRREGMGSVSLTMPEGKTLPAGTYQITLMLGKKDLKSLTFEVN